MLLAVGIILYYGTMLEVVRTTANVKVFKQRISHTGCDNSRTSVPEVHQNYGLVLLCF